MLDETNCTVSLTDFQSTGSSIELGYGYDGCLILGDVHALGSTQILLQV